MLWVDRRRAGDVIRTAASQMKMIVLTAVPVDTVLPLLVFNDLTLSKLIPNDESVTSAPGKSGENYEKVSIN